MGEAWRTQSSKSHKETVLIPRNPNWKLNLATEEEIGPQPTPVKAGRGLKESKVNIFPNLAVSLPLPLPRRAIGVTVEPDA